MKPVHDRQRTQRTLDVVRVEDVISEEILEDELVDRDYLTHVFREPQRFLPPPRVRQRPRPKPAREPESPLARRAKLAGLIVAAALLAGSIVTASTLAGQRGHNEQNPPQPTWTAALDGFALAASTERHTGNGSSVAGPAATATEAASEDKLPVRGGPGPAPSHPATPQSDGAAAPRPADKIATVRKFYRLMDTNPEGALSLLDPILAARPGDLLQAWRSMESIEVTEAQTRADGSVLAVVTMRQADGVHLRITQLLRFADGVADLISEARLLSAERLDCSGQDSCEPS